MSETVSFKMSTHALWRAIDEHHRTYRKTYQELFLIAAKGVAAKAVRLTPPFKWQRSSKDTESDKEGRQRGIKSLDASINRLFTTSLRAAQKNGLQEPQTENDQKSNSALNEMHRYHQTRRNNYGKVPRNHKPVRWVTKAAKESYAKKARKRIGYLASGWVQGAQKVQASLPSWVKKHRGPGSAQFEISLTRLYFRMTNSVGFPTKDMLMTSRIPHAVRLQVTAMMRQLVYKTKKRVKL
jgi:hypothetical protein